MSSTLYNNLIIQYYQHYLRNQETKDPEKEHC